MSATPESAPIPGSAAATAPRLEGPPRVAPTERLPGRTLVWLSLPLVGLGFLQQWFGIYWMKFGTDVVGIAPATIGAMLLASRLFDAVSDPCVGYWSDRTRHRLGRRRPWILASALPLAIATVLLWAPPTGLSPQLAALWLGIALIAYTAATTVLNVPHDALSAELTPNYHERNRLFGVRRAFVGIGTLAVFAVLGPVLGAEDPRRLATLVAIGAAGLVAVGAIACAMRIREPAAHRGRGAKAPLEAWRSVWRNPPARLLLSVFFVQQIGIGSITVMAAYYTEYVLGNAHALVPTMGALFVAAILSIPLWVRLGRHFDKRSLVLVAMGAVGICLASLGFIAPGGEWMLYAAAAAGGVAIGALDVLFPSIQPM